MCVDKFSVDRLLDRYHCSSKIKLTHLSTYKNQGLELKQKLWVVFKLNELMSTTMHGINLIYSQKLD